MSSQNESTEKTRDVPQMERREIRLVDGRYMIFFTFEGRSAAMHPEENAAGGEVQKENV